MNKKEFNIDSLKKCINQLEASFNDYNNISDMRIKEYIRDACIKRFEYSIETAWKLMKRFLKLEYGKKDQDLTINNIFRLMAGYGFILSWEDWRYYYSKRNDTSHEYNQEKAEEILYIMKDFIKDIKFLYEKLESSIEE